MIHVVFNAADVAVLKQASKWMNRVQVRYCRSKMTYDVRSVGGGGGGPNTIYPPGRPLTAEALVDRKCGGGDYGRKTDTVIVKGLYPRLVAE